MLTLKRNVPAALGFHPVQAAVPDVARLSVQLVRWSFINLIMVACLGVLLRALPLLASFPLAYKNVLHGHSHFAFGGWVMPLLLALILKSFPELARAVEYRHWRNIALALLVSAYGMMLAFPLQGYAATSIFFATLSLVAGFYLAIVIWGAAKHLPQTPALSFLKWGLLYLALSAAGPFATGPLVAMGQQGTPLYLNAIYFYLHFTYNGWFTFAVLALWYQYMDAHKARHGRQVFMLMNAACIPAFALSVLWTQPHPVVYLVGAIAGLLQLGAVFFLLKNARNLYRASGVVRWLLLISLLAFIFKNVLQAASAVPQVSAMAALYRNIVVAYLHLVLLGFVSMFLVARVMQLFRVVRTRLLLLGILLFLIAFTGTELLLAGSGFGWIPSYYVHWLLLFSTGMLAGIGLIAAHMQLQERN